jgi:hypothetical protein
MSYSTDPVLDADRHTASLYASQAAQEQAEAAMDRGFRAACDLGDAKAMAPWAPLTTDWDAVNKRPVDQRHATSLPKRQQTLAEVMFECLDMRAGPDISEAMQLILNVANGKDPQAAIDQARSILNKMVSAYVAQNAEAE